MARGAHRGGETFQNNRVDRLTHVVLLPQHRTERRQLTPRRRLAPELERDGLAAGAAQLLDVADERDERALLLVVGAHGEGQHRGPGVPQRVLRGLGIREHGGDGRGQGEGRLGGRDAAADGGG